ncbi:MAG: helix-turn-helix domain-containing protein [Candidatus Limnocylindrales bacterium]
MTAGRLSSAWDWRSAQRGCRRNIELTVDERERLERRVRRQTATQREVFRAQIVLLAASGLRNDEIAERLGTVRETVSRWRRRFFEERDEGLVDRPRSGRPGVFSPSGGRRDQDARL